MTKLLVRSSALLLLLSTAAAADWPQWLGPNRDTPWAETGLTEKFPKDGPPILWKREMGPGYAGPAVVGGKIYVMDRTVKPRDEKNPPPPGTIHGTERVFCLNAADGKELWKHEYDCTYVKISYSTGPRTTPVVEKDRLYTLGTMGDLKCLNIADGKPIWEKSFPKDYKAPSPAWGWSAHLLVDGDKLIALVGGEGQAVVAFDKKTGKELWKALSTQEICYSPPVIVEAGGKRQLIVWHSEAVHGLNPETGEVYWRHKHPAEGTVTRPAVSIITPKLAGDVLIVSSFYDGTLALKLAKDKPDAAVLWRTKPAKTATLLEGINAVMSSLLVKDGYFYGLNGMGHMVCQEVETGKVVWKSNDLFGGKDAFCGTVFWVEAEGRIYGMTDQGDLVILKLSPGGYEELSRAHVLEPTHAAQGRKAIWTHPAFVDKKLYVKNDKVMICVSLAK